MAATLSRLQPVHHEIMRRLMLGQSQRDIALDMGRNETALSAIIRSPLFQLEYRKIKDQEMQDILEIRKEVIEAGILGAKLHKSILTTNTVDGIAELLQGVPLQLRQRSATDMLALATRITRINSIAPQEADGTASYERILEETTTKRITERVAQHNDGNDGNDGSDVSDLNESNDGNDFPLESLSSDDDETTPTTLTNEWENPKPLNGASYN